jgi:hypothetical protein
MTTVQTKRLISGIDAKIDEIKNIRYALRKSLEQVYRYAYPYKTDYMSITSFCNRRIYAIDINMSYDQVVDLAVENYYLDKEEIETDGWELINDIYQS